MHTKIWIASVAVALGALPAGKTPAQPIAPGSSVQAHATLPQPASPAFGPGGAEPAAVSPEAERQALEAYGKLPLSFVPNAGQTNASIRLYAQGSGFRFAFRREEALFAFTRTEQGKTKGAAVALRFLGARPDAEPTGGRPGTGRVNYLLGNDPTRWRTNLPTYEEVVYPNLWPGIDLVFRGADGQLKYEFVLRPGAEVADIRLAYEGAERLSLDRKETSSWKPHSARSPTGGPSPTRNFAGSGFRSRVATGSGMGSGTGSRSAPTTAVARS
jgi:hypothetical protein